MFQQAHLGMDYPKVTANGFEYSESEFKCDREPHPYEVKLASEIEAGHCTFFAGPDWLQDWDSIPSLRLDTMPGSNKQPSISKAFVYLADRDPRLWKLLADVLVLRAKYIRTVRCGNPNPNHWFYGVGPDGKEGIKMRLVDIMGWHRRCASGNPSFDKTLATNKAWEVAYHTLYDLLPECHGCDWCK